MEVMRYLADSQDTAELEAGLQQEGWVQLSGLQGWWHRAGRRPGQGTFLAPRLETGRAVAEAHLLAAGGSWQAAATQGMQPREMSTQRDVNPGRCQGSASPWSGASGGSRAYGSYLE